MSDKETGEVVAELSADHVVDLARERLQSALSMLGRVEIESCATR